MQLGPLEYLIEVDWILCMHTKTAFLVLRVCFFLLSSRSILISFIVSDSQMQKGWGFSWAIIPETSETLKEIVDFFGRSLPKTSVM